MLYALMPYWNDAPTLEAAVRSCIPHVDRVVLVAGAWEGMPGAPEDGRSTDGSDAIAHALAKEMPGIVHVIGPRLWKHQMEQRNAGLIHRKQTDWAILLDADETLEIARTLALERAIEHAEGLGLRCLGIERRVHGDEHITTQTRLLSMRGFGGWGGGHHVVRYDGQDYMLHVIDAQAQGVRIHDKGPKHRPAARLKAKEVYDAGARGGEKDGQHLGPLATAQALEGAAANVVRGHYLGRGAAWLMVQASRQLRELTKLTER